MIEFSDFLKIDIRVGTVLSAEINKFTSKPSLILIIDFGDNIGLKKTSAQLLSNYNLSELLDKQVAAVINFRPKQIGKMISEVLVLGFPDDDNEPILVSPSKKIRNGGKLF